MAIDTTREHFQFFLKSSEYIWSNNTPK